MKMDYLSRNFYFCWAKTSYLSKYLLVKDRAIRKSLQSLKEKNLISIRHFDREKRHIILSNYIDLYYKAYPENEFKTYQDFENYIIKLQQSDNDIKDFKNKNTIKLYEKK
jgi:hypothetical protein